MAILKCKMCGGNIEFVKGSTVGVCNCCGTTTTLPKIDDDRLANLFNRANHFRMSGDFDKAATAYEHILEEDDSIAEAHWGAVLSKFGIEYVEDPDSHKRIPTCHRTSWDSILRDADYLDALKYAESDARTVYEDEATTIDSIQKGILSISKSEAPYDIFICYKETTDGGSRTKDSVLAQDLYDRLTKAGYRVFFSRITLEDKLGTQYEPYIFSALNSAKVMLVIGTSGDNFNAVWVKNEWSRFLQLCKKDTSKHLIPCYRDMDIYDMPEELSMLQSQDMSKIGFEQDLLRGIEKIIGNNAKSENAKQSNTSSSNTTTAPLLERAFMFLEDGNWSEADKYCERVLDQEPKSAQAYLGKLMAALHVHKQEKLRDCPEPFYGNPNYQKAIRFGNPELINSLNSDIAYIRDRNETARKTAIYNKALEAMKTAKSEEDYKAIAAQLQSIAGFHDADNFLKASTAKAEEKRLEAERLMKEAAEKAENLRKDAVYNAAKATMKRDTIDCYAKAINEFRTIPGWKDADELIFTCQHGIERIKAEEAEARIEAERQAELARLEAERERRRILIEKKRRKRIALICAAIGVVVLSAAMIASMARQSKEKEEQYNQAVSLMSNGQYEEAITLLESISNYKNYKDIETQINNCTAAIKERDYSAAVALMDNGEYEEAIMAFERLEGYKDSGSRVENCQTAIKERDYNAAVALMNSGQFMKAIASFEKLAGYKDTNERIRAVLSARNSTIAASDHTVWLGTNGKVKAIGYNYYGQCQVGNWTDVVSLAAGGDHTVGLKANGTVVVAGNDNYGACDIDGWTDIVAIAAGGYHTVGLKSDGTVVATKAVRKFFDGIFGYKESDSYCGQDDVSDWQEIVAITAGSQHTVGLKADGTVVAVGSDDKGQCRVELWRDIVSIAAYGGHTVGLKADGSVVAVGDNEHGQCEVSGWTDIVAIATGAYHTVGLKADGTVVSTKVEYSGLNTYAWGQDEVADWTDVISIAAGYEYTIGLKSDGSLLAVGHSTYDAEKVDNAVASTQLYNNP